MASDEIVARRGVTFEIVWFDNDVIQLRVQAASSSFVGTAEVYVSHDVFRTVADAMMAFPTNTTDVREFEIGTFDSRIAGGGTRFHLWCSDALGHSAMRCCIRADTPGDRHLDQTAEFVMPVEPNDIDRFVQQLAKVPIAVGATAMLRSLG
jgi:hypothetical protein